MWKYLVYLQESRRKRGEAIRDAHFERAVAYNRRRDAWRWKHKRKITAASILTKAVATLVVFPALVIRGGFPMEPLWLAGLAVGCVLFFFGMFLPEDNNSSGWGGY